MRKLDNLEDLANWHYETAKEMYGWAKRSKNERWRDALIDVSRTHLKAARMARAAYKKEETDRQEPLEEALTG